MELLSPDGSRWYHISYGGASSGCLSFGTTRLNEEEEEELKEAEEERGGSTGPQQRVHASGGTVRPKQFDTQKEARKYFGGYVAKKAKEGFIKQD